MYVDQTKTCMKFLSYIVKGFQIIYVIAIIFNNGFLHK